MAILKNCCFCISLRNGGIVLGVLSLLGALLLFTTSCIAMYGVVNADANTRRHATIYEDTTPMPERKMAWTAWIFMMIYLGMCLLTIMCAIMLIYGAIHVSRIYLGKSSLYPKFSFLSLAPQKIYNSVSGEQWHRNCVHSLLFRQPHFGRL